LLSLQVPLHKLVAPLFGLHSLGLIKTEFFQSGDKSGDNFFSMAQVPHGCQIEIEGHLVPQSNPNSATMLLDVGKCLLYGNLVGEAALEIIGQSVHVPAPAGFLSSISLPAPS
jgi:hypothetical protein